MITLRASRPVAVPVAFIAVLMQRLYSGQCRPCQVLHPEQSDSLGQVLLTGVRSWGSLSRICVARGGERVIHLGARGL